MLFQLKRPAEQRYDDELHGMSQLITIFLPAGAIQQGCIVGLEACQEVHQDLQLPYAVAPLAQVCGVCGQVVPGLWRKPAEHDLHLWCCPGALRRRPACVVHHSCIAGLNLGQTVHQGVHRWTALSPTAVASKRHKLR